MSIYLDCWVTLMFAEQSLPFAQGSSASGVMALMKSSPPVWLGEGLKEVGRWLMQPWSDCGISPTPGEVQAGNTGVTVLQGLIGRYGSVSRSDRDSRHWGASFWAL